MPLNLLLNGKDLILLEKSIIVDVVSISEHDLKDLLSLTDAKWLKLYYP